MLDMFFLNFIVVFTGFILGDRMMKCLGMVMVAIVIVGVAFAG
jgi:hypothetical protein